MKKILALVLVCVLALSTSVFAAEFSDMPNDWSTSALENAVKNGLLTGDNGMIKASANMTRAEMATIMVRACGAVNTADISAFADVKSGDWFYDSMSKAVAMGAFNGSDGKLNPNSPISRQEAFVVLSRVFGVAYGSDTDKTVLDSFKDRNKIADWAERDVAAIVKQGYASGSDGYLNPLSNITRAEFAVIMDRMVKYYIDEAVATIPNDGNVVIRTKDIDLNGIKSDKMVIIGDAVGAENLIIKEADITGKLVLRAGKSVSLGGNFKALTILNPGIKVFTGLSSIGKVYVCKDSTVSFTAIVTPGAE